MKKLLLTLLLLVTFVSVQGQENKRILVAYFSWGGNTEALAKEIQRQTNADAYKIQPLVPYTTDYQTLAYEISNKEKADNARPALKDTLATLNNYDIIFNSGNADNNNSEATLPTITGIALMQGSVKLWFANHIPSITQNANNSDGVNFITNMEVLTVNQPYTT